MGTSSSKPINGDLLPRLKWYGALGPSLHARRLVEGLANKCSPLWRLIARTWKTRQNRVSALYALRLVVSFKAKQFSPLRCFKIGIDWRKEPRLCPHATRDI